MYQESDKTNVCIIHRDTHRVMTSKLPNNSSLWNTPIFLPLSLSVFLLISGFAVSPIWDPIILEIANTDSQQASYQRSFRELDNSSWTYSNSFTPLLQVSVLVIHTPSSLQTLAWLNRDNSPHFSKLRYLLPLIFGSFFDFTFLTASLHNSSLRLWLCY